MSQLQRLAVSPSQIEADRLQLTDRQQHYLMRVLRLQTGDRFIAMDGAGHGWMAALQGMEAILLEPISAQTELPIAVTLLIALPKNGMDDIVRQATELGVSQIVPVLSARSLLNPSPQKLDRWQRIAQEAAEQSERQIVPTVLPPHHWQEALQIGQSPDCDPGCDPGCDPDCNSNCDPDCNSNCDSDCDSDCYSGCYLYLCEARGDRPPLLTCLRAQLTDRANWLPVTLAVGPEGGWTEVEVEEAIAAGYQPVSLGKRVLRAVTAPIVALALVEAVLDEMN